MRGVRFNCGDADLSQRHLLCKRQYNCGDADLSQRHLLCKRLYNCGDADLSQRHLLCKRLYNCGDTDLSHRHLLCKRQYNVGDKPAAATAAPSRAAAPVTSSAYCACHTTSSRGHGGANPRRSSCHKLCVLRLPHNKQPRPRRRQSAPQLLSQALRTAPASQQGAALPTPYNCSTTDLLTDTSSTNANNGGDKPAAATAVPIRAAAPVTSSAYCACHTTRSRGHGGANPRRSSCHKLCALHLPHNKQPRPRRRHSAPQLLSQALRTAPATQQAAAATAAPIRAAAPVTSSACCNCHTTSSRGHGGANPRHSSCHKLFVLRLPRNK